MVGVWVVGSSNKNDGVGGLIWAGWRFDNEPNLPED